MTFSYGSPTTVTAAEISRNFGQWQDRAMSGPVVVTHHGRARVVMVSAEHYARMEHGDGAGAGPQSAALEVGLSAVLDHMTEGFFAVDDGMVITAVNGAYTQQIGKTAQQCIGVPRSDVAPPGEASKAVDAQLQRVLRTGETVDFVARSGVESGRFYTIRAFPYPGGAAALFLNKTVERSLARQLQEATATENALAALPDVALLKVNIRGLISSVSPRVCALTGLAADTLLSCRLSDLVSPRDRQALAEAIETVMKHGGAAGVETTLVTRTGGELPVRIGLAAIDRQMFTDGISAVILAQGEEQAKAAAATG